MAWRLALLSVLLALSAACGDSQEASPAPESPTSLPSAPATEAAPATTSPPPAPTTEAAPATSSPEEALSPVIAAREALVAQSGRTLEEVEVVSVVPKQWPDACLGVQTNREACSTVITPGYEVVLRLDDVMYTYHTNQQTSVRLVGGVVVGP